MGLLRLAKMRVIRRLQLGTGMLEIMGALAIGSLITAGVVTQTQMYMDSLKDSATAEQLRAYGQASRVYVQTNKEALLSQLSDGSVGNVVVKAADLARYLPPGFVSQNKNPYGHTHCLVVKKNGDAIKAMLFTMPPDNNIKYRISLESQRFVSIMAGLGAGYVEGEGNGRVARGSGWSENLADWKGWCEDENKDTNNSGVRNKYSLAMSLDLYNPEDEQDCRYLSVGNPPAARPGCGDKMTRDLEFASNAANPSNSIRNLSAVFPAAGTLQVKGAANVEGVLAVYGDTDVALGTVKIGGATLRGDASGTVSVGGAIAPGLSATIGASCAGYPVGAIARTSATTQFGFTPSSGGLLTCLVKSGSQVWQTAAADFREEVEVGCGFYNGYCMLSWDNALALSRELKNCFPGIFRPELCLVWQRGNNQLIKLEEYIGATGGSVRQTSELTDWVDPDDRRNRRNYSWEVDLGERSFCALNQNRFFSASNDIPSGAGGGCEVKQNGSRNGRPLWIMKASVSNNLTLIDVFRFLIDNDPKSYGVTCRATCIR